MTVRRADVVVVGGGPVGLAAAIDARLRAMSVTVIEPRTPPVDKACGEGLMPGAVQALRRLGVDPPGEPFEGISYVSGDGRVQARHSFEAGPGLGVRRTALHAALGERAAALGAGRVQDRVVALTQDGARVRLRLAGGGCLEAPWVLGCDGLRSTTRSLLGIGTRSDRRRFGLRRHAAVPPWSRDVEVHWSAAGEAYVTPIAPDRVGIALLCAGGRDFCSTLRAFPALQARLDDGGWAGEVKGAGPMRQRVERRRSGRVLLVGDAAGYVDALTGEGLRTGFACAAAAVDAIRSGDPGHYEQRWRELTRSYRWLTGALVGATRLPAGRAGVVPAAARFPGLFGRAVEALAG